MTRFFADSSFFFALLNREPIGKTPTQQQEVLRSRTIETEDAVSDEIVRRLRDEAKIRGEFAKVHPCASSGDVPDKKEARLLILGPDYPHTAKDAASAARREAANVLEWRGSSHRNYKNTIVFLAPDTNRLRELREAVRQYLAWDSIWGDRVTLNLDQFQTRQAETKQKNADENVRRRSTQRPAQPDRPPWHVARRKGWPRAGSRAVPQVSSTSAPSTYSRPRMSASVIKDRTKSR